MSNDSPAVIIFDTDGYQVTVSNGDEINSSLPISGKTIDGYAAEVLLNNDGSLATKLNTSRFEKLTVGDTETIYVGNADVGSLDSDEVWLIKKIYIEDGFPVYVKVSERNVSWEDRISLTYS